MQVIDSPSDDQSSVIVFSNMASNLTDFVNLRKKNIEDAKIAETERSKSRRKYIKKDTKTETVDQRRKSVKIGDLVFMSIKAAAKHFNVTVGTITYRCKSKRAKYKDWDFYGQQTSTS